MSLQLRQGEYAVVGAGALIPHGLPRATADLDVVVQGGTLARLEQHPEATIVPGSLNEKPVIQMFGGVLEFSREWFGPRSAAELIARADELRFEDAEVVEKIAFATLADVLAYKKAIGRAKDLEDLAFLTHDESAIHRPSLLPLSR